jgi:hypothetical protein
MAPLSPIPAQPRPTRSLVGAALLVAVLTPTDAQRAAPAALIPSTSLDAQPTQSALTERWPAATNPRLSWFVLDLPTGQVLSRQGLDPDLPIPVGSLTKPFLALAYARTHTTFPHLPCKGSADRCWLPQGHGTLDLQAALAHSCNAYFLALARQTDPAALASVVELLSLPAPPPDASPETLIGLNPDWQIAPATLAHAYARLLTQPDAAIIREGLRQSASTGTASALHLQDALAKTGTAPCHHRGCIASADGLVLVITPAATPRTLLLLRQQGSTGAATSTLAAQMLPLLLASQPEAAHAR